MAAEIDRFQEQRQKSIKLTLVGLGASLLLGGVALGLAQQDGMKAALGIGGMVFLAAFAVGAVLGFLFAVPRVLSENAAAPAADDHPQDPAEDEPASESSISRRVRGRLLGSNTNLERISDWLTTMLVGVGLSQIGSVPRGLTEFSAFLERECPPGLREGERCLSTLPMVGPMILIFGLVLGFLFLYLFTRLVIVTLLNDVERVIDGSTDLGQVKIEDSDARQATVDAARSLDGANENPTLRAVTESGAPSVGESLAVMNTLLYHDNGYQQVIDLGNALAKSAAVRSARYWVYLAAAFGQKFHYLKNNGGSETDVRSARDSALDCVRRALAIRPDYKAWIWRISNPNGPDNDLQEFRKDPEFLAALGRK